MVIKWLPWKYLVGRFARAHGFVDPFTILARLEDLAQPSEIHAPIELLRAGAHFHARGLINSKVIQHNLDWVWPYWVDRQFDPGDPAFMPRAFSLTHVNLTHRNWTAIGLPDCNAFPIVAPRGLLTPFFDGWSLDVWIIPEEGEPLLPSRAPDASQRMLIEEDRLAVETTFECAGARLRLLAHVEAQGDAPICRLECEAMHPAPAWLVVSLRPFNPEGVSFIHHIALEDDRRLWCVEKKQCIRFDEPVERHTASRYTDGDVFLRLLRRPETAAVHCRAGLSTGAAMFRLQPGVARRVALSVDLSHDLKSEPILPKEKLGRWKDALDGVCRLRCPDEHFNFLWDAAVRSLVLLSPLDVYPGPYTYKRFWFRDAALIAHAMLCAGLVRRAETVLDRFPHRQGMDGFFHSQAGEWDANGEVLWIFHRFCLLTGIKPKEAWREAILTGARWIGRKRLPKDAGTLHDGLLPAGFSAEHLGNNDYYYWDDFWSVAGLRVAADMAVRFDRAENARDFRAEADDLMESIERSLRDSAAIREHPGIPASPHRRMDAGAIGSLAVGYPLCLWEPADPRLLGTIEFLLSTCSVQGAFFQDMIHSGINAYLTLHMAQVLLRAGDPRYMGMVQAVARLASPTGQWPEAIHPRTHGGCMGDGHHLWASAEWVMMLRNMFVREEGDRLILASGIPADWIDSGREARLGPAPTPYGPIEVAARQAPEGVVVEWSAQWRGKPPVIEVRVPGHRTMVVEGAAMSGKVETRRMGE